jgi:hypothetical protein
MDSQVSTGRKSVPDDAISRDHIDEAIKTLLSKVSIDHKHWIPYLGGYNQNFKKDPEVFFDARFPDTLDIRGKTMQPFRYILIHECVEKSLMDELGLRYLVAHDFATACERSAVEADGFSWADYCNALRRPIREVSKKPANLLAPDDLDLTPYQQEKAPMLKQIEASQ